MKGKLFFLCALMVITVAVLPGMVSACGGFFCQTTPIDQSAERIIFAVNSDEGTITAIVGINYVGAAEDFSWVVPVPSPPELDVADVVTLNNLQVATDVQLNTPPNYCQDLFVSWGKGGGGGDGDPLIGSGQVGPYDYAILDNADPDELVKWLRDNDYRVTKEMEPLIKVYVDEGMYFLAMRLSQGSDTGDIQPVVMTYNSVKPMIPIRLTAVAAVDDMPVLTWIFGDTQYVPENYAHPQPEIASFRAPHGILNLSQPFGRFSAAQRSYIAEQSRIQETYNGLAFITEYAAPTNEFTYPDWMQPGDPLLNELLDKYPYLTRLRAQMSPGQMTIDPVFTTAPDTPEISNLINVSRYVDGLEYWGCSSRTAIDESVLTRLPGGKTYIDELHMDVPHFPWWQLSEIPGKDETIWVLAGELMDAERLHTVLTEPVAYTPLIVLAKINTFFEFEPDLSLEQVLREKLGLSPDGEISPFTVGVRYHPILPDGQVEGVLYGIFTGEDQFVERVYDPIEAYMRSYQYFANPEMRHTLFLDTYYFYDIVLTIPYPDGWRERLENNTIVIAPEGDSADAPRMHLRLLNTFADPEDFDNERTVNNAVAWLEEAYGLSDLNTLDLLNQIGGDCSAHLPPTPFEFAGRQGTIYSVYGYIVEISAPVDDYPRYQATLATMLDAVISTPCNVPRG